MCTTEGSENKNSTRLCVQYYRPDTSMRSVYARERSGWRAIRERMRPRIIKSVDNRRGAKLRDPTRPCVWYNRPETLERSVCCWREERVASDRRKDAATENRVCIRKQNWGKNKRPDTSMRSVWCWRKAGASSARSEKDVARRIKDVDNRSASTMRDPTPWCVR
jgi:hypothetical protein